MERPCTSQSYTAQPSLNLSPRRCRAFSLVEMLVVIAILSIMLVLGASVGPGLLKSNAMSSGLSQLSSAVSLARSEAVRARKPVIFALAQTNPLDDRSYRSYAILQADSIHGTNYTYIRRWEKLPQGVFFQSGNSTLSTNSLPYPNDNGATTSLLGFKFIPEGSLDEDAHPVGTQPTLALQKGVRMTATSPVEFQGDYQTNQVTVQRLTGKVRVVRD